MCFIELWITKSVKINNKKDSISGRISNLDANKEMNGHESTIMTDEGIFRLNGIRSKNTVVVDMMALNNTRPSVCPKEKIQATIN